MSSKVEKLEANKVKLEITVSAEEFNAALDKAFRQNASKINIPGFRKGKAPRNVIEKYYGEGIMYEDAFDIVAQPAYEAAIDEHKVVPVDRPSVDIIQIGKDQDMIFTAEVVVRPEVTLGDYKGISVVKKVHSVGEAEVTAELNSMREKNSRLVTVEDRELRDGDISNIDFEGFVDGVAFEGGKGEGFDLTIGSGQFIPGFEEQLIGMKLNETREINVQFPDEYHSADLAGKMSMFRVTLNSIKYKELPELDDEFAKDVSDFDTLEELKADIVKKISDRNEKNMKLQVEDDAIKTAAKNATIDIPEVMIEHEIDHVVQEYNWRLQMQGMNLDTYLKMMNMDMHALREQFKPAAEERVRVQLTLDKIAEVEKIEVTKEDIDAKIEEMAANYGEKADMFRNSLKPEDINYFEGELKVQKIAEFLVSNAKVTEEACDCHDHEEKPAKKTTKKTTKKAAEEVFEEVTEEAPKKRTRKTTKKEETAE
ncbi:MAG: trigger factor [Clostridia bacterium]|nr:trigger factor [Clostridia bacterium]